MTINQVMNNTESFYTIPVCKENGIWAVYFASTNTFEILDYHISNKPTLPRHMYDANEVDLKYIFSKKWQYIRFSVLAYKNCTEWAQILDRFLLKK